MSVVDFIILGLIMESPKSAYELTKEVEFRSMTRWVKISSPAIYKNMPKLESKSLLKGQKVKQGEMPEKVVYHITEKGQEYFFELMDKFSDRISTFNLSFTPVIMNIDKVPKDKAHEIIKKLQSNIASEIDLINKKIDLLPEMKPTASSIVDLYKSLYTLLGEWFIDFENAYEQEAI